jgi:hypothetical protein
MLTLLFMLMPMLMLMLMLLLFDGSDLHLVQILSRV